MNRSATTDDGDPPVSPSSACSISTQLGSGAETLAPDSAETQSDQHTTQCDGEPSTELNERGILQQIGETVRQALGAAGYCAAGIDILISDGKSSEELVSVRKRCVERGFTLLSRGVDHGYNDAGRLAGDPVLKSLRTHPGYPALVDRARRTQHAK
jgi:hypothetical protein